jgi:hypothetical protein
MPDIVNDFCVDSELAPQPRGIRESPKRASNEIHVASPIEVSASIERRVPVTEFGFPLASPVCPPWTRNDGADRTNDCKTEPERQRIALCWHDVRPAMASGGE